MLLQCSLALLMLQAASGQRRAYSPIPPAQQQQPSAVSRPEAPSDILEQVSELSPDGTYHTKWSTANGISVEEFGQPKSLPNNELAEDVQGSASWTSADGQPISLSWHADENGAVFQGEHLPTAPPIPALIQRALDFLAANPPKPGQEGAYYEDAADQPLGPAKPKAYQGFPTTRRPRRSPAAARSAR